MTKRKEIRATQNERATKVAASGGIAYEGGAAPAAAPVEAIKEEEEPKPEAAAPAAEQAV